MKRTNHLFTATAIAMSYLLAGQGLAQASTEQSKQEMAATPSLTDGVVRKIDPEAGKITIKHGEIKHLDMPGMTMVFVAKDKSVLNKVKVGDKVRFMVIYENGKMVVTDLQAAN